MDFLKRNSGKLALCAIIAFFTLPFIYGNEEEEDFSPFAVKSGMSYQANPISKLANRIASFYGFAKPANELVASNGVMDPVKNKLSDHHAFNKEDISIPKMVSASNRRHDAKNKSRRDPAKEEFLSASAKRFKNFDVDFENAVSSNTGGYSNSSSSSYSNFSGVTSTRANSPIKGKVKINGQEYTVIEDAKGEKYIVTPKGHVPYKEVVRRSFSEKEFLATKKRLGNASDMEVLQELQRERAQKESTNGSANYANNGTGYRGGAVSSMGGHSYAAVSTSDKGFDDNVLSNAYADLNGINLKGEMPSVSYGGGYSGGGSYGGWRDSFNGGNSSTANADQGNSGGSGKSAQGGGVFTPSGFAREAKAQAQNDILKAKEENTKQESQEDQKIQEQNSGFYAVKKVIKQSDNTYITKIKEGDESGYVLAIDPSYAQEWPGLIKAEVDEKEGLILPVKFVNGILEPGEDFPKEDKKQLNDMNESINSISDKIFNLLPEGTKIYIEQSDSDDVSIDLIKAINGGYLTILDSLPSEEDHNVFKLHGIRFTSGSFQEFDSALAELAEQLKKQNEEQNQEGNLPA